MMFWAVALVWAGLTTMAWAGSVGGGGTSTVNTTSTTTSNTTSTTSDSHTTTQPVKYTTSRETRTNTRTDATRTNKEMTMEFVDITVNYLTGWYIDSTGACVGTYGSFHAYDIGEHWVWVCDGGYGQVWTEINVAYERTTTTGRTAAYSQSRELTLDWTGDLWPTWGPTTTETTHQDVIELTSKSLSEVTKSTTTSDPAVSYSTSNSSQAVRIGDFTLGTTAVVNTNRDTATNVNTNTHTETTVQPTSNTNTITTITTVSHYDVVHMHNVQYTTYESLFISPIVLDLSGTGVLDASGGNWLPHNGIKGSRMAMFDIHANEMDVPMEWVGPNAGLLCQPKADGSIDGNCLFGTSDGYANGFEKLRVRDTNGDGVLTGAELNGLLVWVDENGNGKAERSELRTLASLGVTSLSTRHNNFKSTFAMKGKNQTMWDWWPTALNTRLTKVSDLR